MGKVVKLVIRIVNFDIGDLNKENKIINFVFLEFSRIFRYYRCVIYNVLKVKISKYNLCVYYLGIILIVVKYLFFRSGLGIGNYWKYFIIRIVKIYLLGNIFIFLVLYIIV